MSLAHVVATIVAALMAGFAAVSSYIRAGRVGSRKDVPVTWLPWLGAAGSAGAAGLLAGMFVPLVGYAAGVGLVLYFIVAVIAVMRARGFDDVPSEVLFMAPVVGALMLAS
ncbi:hypothetical protein SRB5_42890 [Streptomyces sp. RB5]|uniref:Integral membrane protein n=1 Tax=Streptomyces smaragdinus TaxID=2585196 RepID=A0A7K0CKW8_9ACTN|nr:DoxX family protein [Streptomyces smaragdinus]MQY14127.1 hypothetical protein [Streptomyces smaragdinus]